jgi:hypothetical protein
MVKGNKKKGCHCFQKPSMLVLLVCFLSFTKLSLFQKAVIDLRCLLNVISGLFVGTYKCGNVLYNWY